MDIFNIIINIVSIVIGYLIGSILPGYIFGKLKGIDIREKGSGVAGTGNTYKVLGPKYGILTGIYDFFKGIISIFIAIAIGADFIFAQISGLAAIAGHVLPFYINFRGGHGMACASGILLSYLLNYMITSLEMFFFMFLFLPFIVAITLYISRYGIVVSIFVLPFLPYAAYLYYPNNQLNIFLLILVLYNIGFVIYHMQKGVREQFEIKFFKSYWWRMALRPLAILFVIFYFFNSFTLTLLIIGIVAAFFISLDIIRLSNRKINDMLTIKIESLYRSEEFDQFSNISIFLLSTFLTVLLLDKTIAIIALLFLIFDLFSERINNSTLGKHRFFQTTFEGVLAYFGCLIVCVYILLPILNISLIILIVGGIIAVIVKMLPLGISDKFLIPILSGSAMTIAVIFF